MAKTILAKGEMFKGVVTRETEKGVYVAIDGIDGEGFCRCNLQKGDVAWFVLISFVITVERTSLKLGLDNIIRYAPAA